MSDDLLTGILAAAARLQEAWTFAKTIAVVSALAGALGTWLLVHFSFAFEHGPGYYADAETAAQEMLDRNRRNKQRALWQRRGLWLLLISFLLQTISVLIS